MTITWPGGVRLEDIEHDDPRWLARRQECIGASEIAGMLGLGKYGSPAQVYLGKVGTIVDIDNEAMALGRGMEDEILRHAVGEIGGWQRGGSDQGTYAHKDEPRMTATPDGWYADSTGQNPSTIEIKFTAARGAAEEWTALQAFIDGEGPLPAYTAAEQYYIQIQAQMEVLDVDDGYLCVCIGERAGLKLTLGLGVTDDEVRILYIQRDRELGAMMVKQVGAFWSRYVDAGVCPATTEADLEALRKSWPIAEQGSSIVLRGHGGAVRKLKHAKVKVKAWEKVAKTIEASLRAAIGTAETADVGGGHTLTLKTTHRKESTRTIAASSFRTLRVVKPKRGKR